MDCRSTPYRSLRFDEKSWLDSLRLIEEGEIVPVVRPELMEVEAGNGPELFHTWAARALAESFFRVGLAALLLVLELGAAAASEPPPRFAAMYCDPAVFEQALAKESVAPPAGHHVTGITVPHHLVAADLIARGFRCASGENYERIILLSPDHFRRSRLPFATTRGTFETVFGDVACDETAVGSLLAACPKVAESVLFAKEHGVHAVLPFVARFFPTAKIVPVALRIDSKREDWLALADALAPLVNSKTLIVQSTDFSHYLSLGEARRRDQQTMIALALGDPEAVARLRQPAHMDSKAAQFVQMVLQWRIHHARPVVIANRNSQAYTSFRQERTTSYIVQVYEPDDPPPSSWPPGAEEAVWFFAGDAFFGRRVASMLAQPSRAEAVRKAVLRITQGHPLAVNLEGVIVTSLPDAARVKQALVMEKTFTLDWLKSLNVKIAGLANNHALDGGEMGLAGTASALAAAGITPARDGEVIDAGPFRVVALTDLSNASTPHTGRITRETIARLARPDADARPFFALLHWGAEFRREATPRQIELMDWLEDSPVTTMFGAHPHVDSGGPEPWRGGDGLVCRSLGNFLFDQQNGSGALAEVRFFEDKTFAVRWILIKNLLQAQRTTAPR
jgi:AmmeMemoRadiSam system protein B